MNRFKPPEKSNINYSTSDNMESCEKVEEVLKLASKDKLRVLSQTLVEMLLNFSIEYDFKVFNIIYIFYIL